MKAVILVGGEGTRLRPLTINTPKPMVPVVNRPFLEHMITHLKRHGISEIVLAMAYLPDRIRSYFGEGDGLGVRLTYVVESVPLGTAGAVKNVSLSGVLLDDTFFVFNGDVYSNLDLTTMLALHRERKAVCSIALTPVEDPTIYGVVETEADGRVRRFVEKPRREEVTSNMINAGTYILEPSALERVPPGAHYMFERGLFPGLLQAGQPVYAYPSYSYWIDIGTPEKYAQVHRDILTGKATPIFDETPNDGAQVHPGARLEGPVVLGKGCIVERNACVSGPTVLGPGCIVHEGAVVQGAVLWQGARIGSGALLRNCLVGQNACIGEGVWILDGAVLGDDISIGRGAIVKENTRLDPGTVIAPAAN